MENEQIIKKFIDEFKKNPKNCRNLLEEYREHQEMILNYLFNNPATSFSLMMSGDLIYLIQQLTTKEEQVFLDSDLALEAATYDQMQRYMIDLVDKHDYREKFLTKLPQETDWTESTIDELKSILQGTEGDYLTGNELPNLFHEETPVFIFTLNLEEKSDKDAQEKAVDLSGLSDMFHKGA